MRFARSPRAQRQKRLRRQTARFAVCSQSARVCRHARYKMPPPAMPLPRRAAYVYATRVACLPLADAAICRRCLMPCRRCPPCCPPPMPPCLPDCRLPQRSLSPMSPLPPAAAARRAPRLRSPPADTICCLHAMLPPCRQFASAFARRSGSARYVTRVVAARRCRVRATMLLARCRLMPAPGCRLLMPCRLPRLRACHVPPAQARHACADASGHAADCFPRRLRATGAPYSSAVSICCV